ncbi:MAG: DUF4445 domain-containing protein [Chitinivibrionales bacterium]|nr:DUF4445 domain-containing protein [Chitinivibrionales bacterium]
MPEITFFPANIAVDARPGESLPVVAQRCGVKLSMPCGGQGTCTKCRIKIVEGQLESKSIGGMEILGRPGDIVLACQSRTSASDVKLSLLDLPDQEKGSFEDDGATQAVTKFAEDISDLSTLIQSTRVTVPPPELEDGLCDEDRLIEELRQKLSHDAICLSLPALQKLAQQVRADKGRIECIYIAGFNRAKVLDVNAANALPRPLGLALDLGTTSIAVQLADLTNGEVLASSADYNGQIANGLDVISRINYARHDGAAAELQSNVIASINQLIDHCLQKTADDSSSIYAASISGNTTMIHLLLGLDPEYIRLEPYTPTAFAPDGIRSGQLGLNLHSEAVLHFAPAVGSYVGGDITSGLLTTELISTIDDVSLFIDIGTNGELVIGNCDFLISCACSAGPAFEGGGISCGMRASEGAIDYVEIDPITGGCAYRTIGEAAPKGICGSGMISLLSNLLMHGLIDARGKFVQNRPCDSVTVDGRKAAYILVHDDTITLTITEHDIENVLRAKAAIYAAITLICTNIGITLNDIARVYIAGGFGKHLDFHQAIILGLLPDLPVERFSYIGNASLAGSRLALLSGNYRQTQKEIAAKMTYIDLSSDPSYMDNYTGALFLPHTDIGLFPTVAKTLKRTGGRS